MKEEFDRAGPVLHLLLRYTQALMTQMVQTAFACCIGRSWKGAHVKATRSPKKNTTDYCRKSWLPEARRTALRSGGRGERIQFEPARCRALAPNWHRSSF